MELTPERARIFRITHIKNVPWILENGLFSKSSQLSDPNFVTIGNLEIIVDRSTWPVPVPPRGTLANYIPFYFTPYSIMMMNIVTGFRGVKQVPRNEIVILVGSLRDLHHDGRPVIFTDRHAKLKTAIFFDSLEDLDKLDWALWQRRDFKRDPDDPEKIERYQAEALIYNHMPVNQLRGMVCFGENERRTIDSLIDKAGVALKTTAQPKWYL